MSTQHDAEGSPLAEGSALEDHGRPADGRSDRHAIEHRVRFDECDAAGSLRPSGWLRLMQELAWQHSDALGMDRAWYASHGLMWLVRAVDLEVLRPVRSGERVRLTTQITGWRRVWARRRTTGVEVDGRDVPAMAAAVAPGDLGVADAGVPREAASPAAIATIDWVLVDAAGRPARIPAQVADRFIGTIPTFQPADLALPARSAGAVTFPWAVSIRDLDPMGHVNNATYLDVIDEALAADRDTLVGPQPPVRYRVEYLRPALPRVTVSVVHSVDDTGTAVRFLDPAGQELVRARVSS